MAISTLKKAHSHLEKVIKMAETGKYSVEVMQQNLAVIGLLKYAHTLLIDEYLKSCFELAIGSKDKRKRNKMVDEIMRVAKLSGK